MNEDRDKAAKKLTEICNDRAHLWGLISEVIGTPDQAWLDRLASGALPRDLKTVTVRLGAEPMKAQKVVTQIRIGIKSGFSLDDANHLSDTWASQTPTILLQVNDQQSLCIEEGLAWVNQDFEAAKELRLRQYTSLHDKLLGSLMTIIRSLRKEETPMAAGLASALILMVSIESGHNIEKELEQ